MQTRQRGFTLIEIMVVVVILAVLGALVVPKILENVDKARVTRAASDIRAIQTALDHARIVDLREIGVEAVTLHHIPAGPCEIGRCIEMRVEAQKPFVNGARTLLARGLVGPGERRRRGQSCASGKQ